LPHSATPESERASFKKAPALKGLFVFVPFLLKFPLRGIFGGLFSGISREWRRGEGKYGSHSCYQKRTLRSSANDRKVVFFGRFKIEMAFQVSKIDRSKKKIWPV